MSATSSPSKDTLADRLGAHGDLPARLFQWGALRCPLWLEPLFVLFYSLLTLALFRQGRRAVFQNLAVIKPREGGVRRFFRAWALWRNFAWARLDTLHATQEGGVIDWEIEGKSIAERLDAQTEGVILMTAHMGSYDLAAAVFAQKMHNPVVAVRAPEQTSRASEFHRKERAGDTTVRHAYNQQDSALGIELLKQLGEGSNVALQGDRVLLHVAGETVPWDERHDWVLPAGPFVLALLSKTTIWPLFVWRIGYRRYHMKFAPEFSAPSGRGDKKAIMKTLRFHWAAILRSVVEARPEQWMAFEEAFQPAQENGPREKLPPPPPFPEEPAHHIPAEKPPRACLVLGLAAVVGIWHLWIAGVIAARLGISVFATPLIAILVLHALGFAAALGAVAGPPRQIAGVIWTILAALASLALK